MRSCTQTAEKKHSASSSSSLFLLPLPPSPPPPPSTLPRASPLPEPQRLTRSFAIRMLKKQEAGESMRLPCTCQRSPSTVFLCTPVTASLAFFARLHSAKQLSTLVPFPSAWSRYGLKPSNLCIVIVTSWLSSLTQQRSEQVRSTILPRFTADHTLFPLVSSIPSR